MSIEERLKELILARYHSIREFTNVIDLPYTTLDSMFRRGIAVSSISNVVRVCKELEISVDALADGEIVFIKKSNNAGELIEIKEIVNDIRNTLSKENVTIDGHPLTVNGIDTIIDAIDVGVELAKKKTKA